MDAYSIHDGKIQEVLRYGIIGGSWW